MKKSNKTLGLSFDPQVALRAAVHPLAWQNPAPATRYDLVILGAGDAGLACAERAKADGARIAIVEKTHTGGTRIHSGGVPSKALLRTARLCADLRRAAELGAPEVTQDAVDAATFASAMQRMRDIRARLARHDAVIRLEREGIDVFFGTPRFVGLDALEVDGLRLDFERAIIATGARPKAPHIPGLDTAGYFTNETIFDLADRPARLGIIGGGPLGCELAQAFQRLGSCVTIINETPLFLPREERDAVQILADAFARDGIEMHLNSEVRHVECRGAEIVLHVLQNATHTEVVVDAVLAGIGRVPNVADMELDIAGVDFDTENGVHVDEFLQSTNPRIYAAGDVCLADKFSHVAVASGHLAVGNALNLEKQSWSSQIIPWCTYTEPEIAHVGIYVRDANDKGIPVKTVTVLLSDIDRAVLDSDEHGFVKIHLRDGSDEILGATIVARNAGDLISEITVAMGPGLGLKSLGRIIRCYPTQSVAIRKAAEALAMEQSNLSTLRQKWP